MDLLAFATAALKLAPVIVQAGEDLAPFVANAVRILEGGSDPTQEDWDKLHATENALRAKLNTDPEPPAAPAA